MVGSKEYRNLMLNTLDQHRAYKTGSTALSCLTRDWIAEERPYDKDILKLMCIYVSHLKGKIKDVFSPQQLPDLMPTLDWTEQMIQDQFLALEPFASMNVSSRSKVTVAIQLPAWFIASPYACSFRKVAEATFGRLAGLESASSSAFTALGHELCRVDQEAYDCRGPGRIATLEYDGHLAVASMIKTPVDIFHCMGTRYSTFASKKSAELSKWINSFLNTSSPDMIALAGSGARLSSFQEAINLSRAAGRIDSDGSENVENILVQGAAQIAKDDLENHNSDCGEFVECEDIRREADRIAGKYEYDRPKVWPAVNNRHWREVEDMEYVTIDMTKPYLQGSWITDARNVLVQVPDAQVSSSYQSDGKLHS